jgi:MFS transporter, SHS family, lactate transporter
MRLLRVFLAGPLTLLIFFLTFVIGDVAKTFGKSAPEVALTLTLALCLRPLGALLFGVMAERIGRRLPLMLNILLYEVISVLSGWAPIIGLS